MPTVTSRTPKIDARAAAQAAAAYFKELYSSVKGFSLEEVELSDDGDYWLITLSFEIPPDPVLGQVFSFQAPRTKYKVFKVDSKSGRVLAMKIRKLE
jgi:hypothetical protein